LDIDSFDDLQAARRRMTRTKLIFRFSANDRIGSGHLHHVLQLSEMFAREEVAFLLKDCDPFVHDFLEARDLAWTAEDDLAANLEVLSGGCPAVIVNDVLDTAVEDLVIQKAMGHEIVCVEDLGAGLQLADWVINAMYEPPRVARAHVDSGPDWATLRTEFHDLPVKEVREEPERILVTFGGTDPGKLAERFVPSLTRLGVEVDVVVGPGASVNDDALRGANVVRDVRSMAKLMMAADLLVTSAGRTVYEAAATGTPVLVLAQNAREATHRHLSYGSGVIFLGIGALTPPASVADVAASLLANVALRAELSVRLRSGLDDRGVSRIAQRLRMMMEELPS
jgi:spore coat polysaccharide biosynthesis predicted glycosyltransferase SpsG